MMRKLATLLMVALTGACDAVTGNSVIKSISVNPSSVTITAPGQTAVAVSIEGAVDMNTYLDTVNAGIITSGPFTGTWSVQRGWRVVNIRATGPGTGSVTVTAGKHRATIAVQAVPISFRSIAVSAAHGCGITTDDRAWCWGENETGQLGHPTPYDCNGSVCQYGGIMSNSTPLPVTAGLAFKQVTTTERFCILSSRQGWCGRSCALTPAGRAWCWGEGYGVVPKEVALGTTFVSLALQQAALSTPLSCGLTDASKAVCFTGGTATPLHAGFTFKALSLGPRHSCAIDGSGDAWCWGDNTRGSLGIGSFDSQDHPTPERVATTAKFTSIHAGDRLTCALDTAQTIHCWGAGYAADGTAPPATCGGSNLCQLTPRPVESGKTYSSVSLGVRTAKLCAVAQDGSVDCWTAFNRAPTQIAMPEPAAFIAAESTSCAILTTGMTYCWFGTGPVTKFPN